MNDLMNADAAIAAIERAIFEVEKGRRPTDLDAAEISLLYADLPAAERTRLHRLSARIQTAIAGPKIKPRRRRRKELKLAL